MNIDLSKVIEYSEECIKNPTLMKSIMMDMYPNEKLEINILVTIQSSGIIEGFRKMDFISMPQYRMCIDRIVNDYGLTENNAIAGLDEWLKYYEIKKDDAIQINKKPIDVTNMEVTENPVVEVCVEDYELRILSDVSAEIKKFLGFDDEQLVVPSKIGNINIIGVGREAYKACGNMRKLVISEGIEYIQDAAFLDCFNLEEVVLPKSLKRLGQIRAITDIERHKFMINQYPSIYTLNNTMGCFGNTSLKEVVLPNALEILGEAVFAKCTALKKVVIPGGVKQISRSSFIGCIALEEIVMSDNIELIDKQAFMACTSLKNLEFPKKLRKIENKAFCMCRSLQILKFNDGLEVIEDEAFRDCNLKNIILPKSINKMGKSIFDYTTVCACYSGSYGLKYARDNGYKVLNAENK